jgi:hypothetical protein
MSDYDRRSFFAAGVEPLREFRRKRCRYLCVCSADGPVDCQSQRNIESLPAIRARFDDRTCKRRSSTSRRRSRVDLRKHSAEFLNAGSTVARELRWFQNPELTKAAVDLAGAFAARAGGIAADAWAVTPDAIAELSATDAIRLLKNANVFFERGGGAALHVLIAGGDILRRAPEIFDEWIALLWVVATHGNASLVAFVRSSPGFIRLLNADPNRALRSRSSLRVLTLTKEIAAVDGEAALACFRSSARALRSVSIEPV